MYSVMLDLPAHLRSSKTKSIVLLSVFCELNSILLPYFNISMQIMLRIEHNKNMLNYFVAYLLSIAAKRLRVLPSKRGITVTSNL